MTRADKLYAADRLREIAADLERQAAELEAEALDGCEVEVEETPRDAREKSLPPRGADRVG